VFKEFGHVHELRRLVDSGQQQIRALEEQVTEFMATALPSQGKPSEEPRISEGTMHTIIQAEISTFTSDIRDKLISDLNQHSTDLSVAMKKDVRTLFYKHQNILASSVKKTKAVNLSSVEAPANPPPETAKPVRGNDPPSNFVGGSKSTQQRRSDLWPLPGWNHLAPTSTQLLQWKSLSDCDDKPVDFMKGFIDTLKSHLDNGFYLTISDAMEHLFRLIVAGRSSHSYTRLAALKMKSTIDWGSAPIPRHYLDFQLLVEAIWDLRKDYFSIGK
jgi:hypothetical protein